MRQVRSNFATARWFHEARVAAVSPFQAGDRVVIPGRFGVHIAADFPATVERVDLDHTHPGGHADTCYRRERVELSLAWGARADGTADLRGRENVRYVRAA